MAFVNFTDLVIKTFIDEVIAHLLNIESCRCEFCTLAEISENVKESDNY